MATSSTNNMVKLQELFQILDLDNNGYIDLDELKDWIKNEVNISIDAKELFNTIDINGNGKIAPEELAEYYKDFSPEKLQAVTEKLYDRHASRIAQIRKIESKDEFDMDIPDISDNVPEVPETNQDEEVNKYEQRVGVKTLMDKHIKELEGETWYAISCKWWETWNEYVCYKLGTERGESNDTNNNNNNDGGDGVDKPLLTRSLSFQYGQHPGPIDNSNISGESNGELKLGISEHYDFKLVPEEVWALLRSWYGGGPAFGRSVVKLSNGSTQIDLWPCFLVMVWCDSLTGKPNPKTVTRRVYSRALTVGDMMKEYGNVAKKKNFNVRLWIKRRKNDDVFEWRLLPSESWSLTLLEAQIVSGDTLLLEKKNEVNKWPRASYVTDNNDNNGDDNDATDGGNESKRDFRDFQIGDEIDAMDTMKNWYHSTVRDVKETKIFVHFEGWSSKWDAWFPIDSEKLAPLGTHSKGRHVSKSQKASWSYARDMSEKGQPIENGTVGLRNLGNTCFMNSTLQCLLNVRELSQYFVQDNHMNELNKDNPLGHMGRVAIEYGDLVKSVWSNSYSVIAPSKFKSTIGEFAPQFSGFQQHDSSELLSFLLDGLHEDLNRILKKPYTQEVESNGRDDSIVAKEAWDTYLLRNNSIIVDLLTGQLKSTIICPECDRVSVKFDPYLFLSVPLPIETTRTIPITLIPFSSDELPVLYGVTVPKQCSVDELRKTMSELCKIAPDTLRLAEVWHGKIYRELNLSSLISQIRGNDIIYAFEIQLPERKESMMDEINKHFNEMKINDVIDARDTDNNWYEANIIESDETRVKVHYSGWSKRWDEWHEKMSKRLAPRNTHSKAKLWEVSCYHTRGRENFGVPFFITVQPNTITNRELRQQILKRCYKLMVEKKGNDDDNDDDDDDDDDENTLVIRLKNSNGTGCGKCKTYSCSGCPLPDDDSYVQFNNKTGAMLAIQWPKSWEFDRDKAERVKRHETAPLPDKVSAAQRKSLADCLEAYTKAETLSKEDAWYCSNCKEFREAHKKFDIYSTPNVCVIHLKRFSYTKHWREKLGTYIDFPLEGLDMSPFMVNKPDKPVLYDLIGVSNHMGGLQGGHYIASVRKDNGKWYNMDDSRVSELRPDEIVSKAAYMLFYQKRQ